MRKQDKKLAKAIFLSLALSTVFAATAGAEPAKISTDTTITNLSDYASSADATYPVNLDVAKGATVTFDLVGANSGWNGSLNSINIAGEGDIIVKGKGIGTNNGPIDIVGNSLNVIDADGNAISAYTKDQYISIQTINDINISSAKANGLFTGPAGDGITNAGINIESTEGSIKINGHSFGIHTESSNAISVTAEKNIDVYGGTRGIISYGNKDVTLISKNGDITVGAKSYDVIREDYGGKTIITAENGKNDFSTAGSGKVILSNNASGEVIITADKNNVITSTGTGDAVASRNSGHIEIISNNGDNIITSGSGAAVSAHEFFDSDFDEEIKIEATEGYNKITSTQKSASANEDVVFADNEAYVRLNAKGNIIEAVEADDKNAINVLDDAQVFVDNTDKALNKITGNINAENDGTVKITFDYDEDFYNLKGYNGDDQKYSFQGKVTTTDATTDLTFNKDALWNLTGTSNVTNLTVNGATVDMSADGGIGSKLTVDEHLNLSGATLKMDLKYIDDKVESYIDSDESDFIIANGEAELGEANTLVIAAKDNDYSQNLDKMDDGNKLYFARIVGEQEASKFNGQKISYVNNKNIYNYTYSIERDLTDVKVPVTSNDKDGGKVMAVMATVAPVEDDETTEKEVKYSDYYITKVQKEVTPEEDPDDPVTPDDPVKPNENITSEKGKMLAGYALATEMDRLNKRLGEARYMEDEKGLWVRYRHNHVGYDNTFTNKGNMFQLGYDKQRIEKDGKHYRGGAIDYTRATTELNNIAGKGEHDRYGVSLYDTWLGNKGHYHDLVIRAGRINSDFDVYNADGKINSDYHRNFASISGEYGRKINGKDGWYVEPQAQLQIARVGEANYTTNKGVRVEQEGATSVLGRLGFRLGREYFDADGNKANNYYFKADYMHEFAGDQAYRVTGADATFREEVSARNFYDIGVGADIKIKKGQYFWADVERTFGGDYDTTWQVNGGFRWEF